MNRFFAVLDKFQRAILFLSSVTVVFAMGLMVFLRYVFETDLYGMDDIIIICGYWIYFIGGAYASMKGVQIRASLIDHIIQNKKILRGLECFNNAFSGMLAVVLCVWSVDMLLYGVAFGGKTPVLRLPLAISHSSLVIGFALMALFHFRDAYAAYKQKSD